MWEREEEYKAELEQIIQKAGTSRLERLASLALEDERTCYKHVLVLLEKQYRKCGPNMRGKLHLLYCVSTLLRQSRKQQGARDRYAERLQPLISALVVDLRLEFSAQIDKLLKLWRMEGVFSAEQMLEVESGRPAQALRQPGLQSKSPSGSLTEASAQDPHMGMGDASGSGRSSAIQSYPRFAGGRAQPAIPGAIPPYQQQPAPDGQDPYSADSNPNGARAVPPPQPPPPPPTLPPPPPPLIPPGLLGPVGPPGILQQGSVAAAAAAAAAAGLFQQGQLGGFLGTPPPALMQQGAFMPALGPFGGGNMSSGMTGSMTGGVGPGLGVGAGVGGVMPGGMGGALPFQGPPGPMPPGLGLQRPPLYPQPPSYNNQGHQGQSQGTRALNTLNYNRFNQSNGRMPPGLGPSSGQGQSAAHGPGQGWQGRFGDGHGAASQGLPPPPPRPPPGSPPHSGDGRGSAAPASHGASASAANGVYRGSGGADSSSCPIPPGLGPKNSSAGVDGGGGSAAGSAPSTQGAAATGYIRPSGRRSRWELERDSSDAPVAESAVPTAAERPAGSEPLPKRPALAGEAGGGSSALAHAPEGAATKPSMPTSEPPAEPSLPSAKGARGGSVPAAPGHAGRSEATAGQPAASHRGGDSDLSQPQQQQPEPLAPKRFGAQTCGDVNATPVAVEDTPMELATVDGPTCSQGVEDVAVADGKADPDSLAEPDERLVRGGAEETVSGGQHDVHGALVSAGKPDAGHLEAVLRAPAAEMPMEGVEVDDGGSSSADAVCPAAQHHDSTAPSSPGRPSGVAEQGDSRDRGGDAAGSHDGQRELVQDEQQQRRSSSSGAGESGNDRLFAALPGAQVADDVTDTEQQRRREQEQEQQRQQQEQEQVGETKAAEAVMSTNLDEAGDTQQRTNPDVQSAAQPPLQTVEQPTMPPAEPGVTESVERVGGDPGREGSSGVPIADVDGSGARPDAAQGGGDDGPQQDTCGQVVPSAADSTQPAAAESRVEAEAPADSATADPGLPQAEASVVAALGAAAASADVAVVAPVAAATTPPTAVNAAADAATAPAQSAAPGEEASMSEPTSAVAPQPADLARRAPAPGPQQAAQVPQPPPLHSSSALLLSSYDSRVPLQLEELELGELDDTWLE